MRARLRWLETDEPKAAPDVVVHDIFLQPHSGKV
jgi:hypothetical protein